jgi:hypothetical protein
MFFLCLVCQESSQRTSFILKSLLINFVYFYCLLHSVEDSATFFVGNILLLVVWAIICAFGAEELRARAALDPGGVAERWVYDIENCKSAVSIIGTLFVFTLVFRFNACYDRWWESRIFWVSHVQFSQFSLLLVVIVVSELEFALFRRVTSYQSV